MTQRKRIVSGMRPTGPLHIGHYFGAIKNWVAFQEEYDCYYFVADWHVITDRHENLGNITPYTREMVADWIACGLDPDRSTFFVQSEIPHHLELSWILGSLAPVGMLQRCPTYKDAAVKLGDKITPNYDLLGYPILQAADIALYRGELVPVGEDQVPHLELSREIIRKFNRAYKGNLPEPQPKLSEVPRLVGTDNQAKMSNKLNNCIFLSDDEDTVNKRVRSMFTDPKRVSADIPGTVEGNPVFLYHDLFNTNKEEIKDLKTRYREGKVGDVEVKTKLAVAINGFLDPIRSKRKELLSKPEHLDELIRKGTGKARAVAEKTMDQVKRALFGIKK